MRYHPPLPELRLAQLTTQEPRPMPPRIRAHDGGAYAWTDDADLYPSAYGGVSMRRPHMPPVSLWDPPVEGRAPKPAAIISAILDALDRSDGWGVVDVRSVVAALEVTP